VSTTVKPEPPRSVGLRLAEALKVPAEVVTSRTGRIMATAHLADSIGSGLFLTISTLFFTRTVGLSTTEVGAGLSIAGIVGVLCPIPLARWADRRDQRRVVGLFNVIQAASFAGLAWARSFPVFLIAVCVVAGAERATRPVLAALVGNISGGAKYQITAFVRMAGNAGFGIGALIAVAVVQIGTASAFIAVLYVNAVSFLAVAVLVQRLDRAPPASPSGRRMLGSWNYISLGGVSGLLGVHSSLLAIGLPLWILYRTSVSHVAIALVLITDTLLVTLLQARAGAKVDTIPGAVHTMALAATAIAASCLVIMTSGWLRPLPGLLVIVAGAVLLAFGEMFQQAGAWGLGYLLAPSNTQAQHLAAFSLGYNVQEVVGPYLVTALCVTVGTGGWIALAVMAVALGGLVPALTRQAQAAAPRPGG